MAIRQLKLRKGKEEPLRRGHPWVFSGALKDKQEKASDGEFVEVTDERGAILGCGFFGQKSIAVKLLSFGKEAKRPLEDILSSHILSAFNFRKHLLLPSQGTTGFRLVNGEGDRLPGLIIDKYNDVAIIQAHSQGFVNSRDTISKLLVKYGIASHIIFHNEYTGGEPEVLHGKPPLEAIIKENGFLFKVDLIHGQKTGFYLDQRENRSFIAPFCNAKKVLNVCSYTGGFSVYALKGAASDVISLDASQDALHKASENCELNDCSSNHTMVKADCFKYLTDSDEHFDVIILDPPAFAKHREAVRGALKGYRSLNSLALKRLKPNGLLATFSCSQLVNRTEFESAVMSAAIDCGRAARVFKNFEAAPCHPVNIFHPEGRYLKGLMLEVA